MKSRSPSRFEARSLCTLPSLLLLSVLAPAALAQQLTFTHLAGSTGGPGYEDGVGTVARFCPAGVAVDGVGNIYVADGSNHTIRRISSTGVVSTVAGLAGSPGDSDGIGGSARFRVPRGVAVDTAGNIYVADAGNTIRKITSGGLVSTVAGSAGSFGSNDGTGSVARFYDPYGVAVDKTGSLYVADTYNHTIRRISPEGVVATLAGLAGTPGIADGTGSAARFNNPRGVAIDTAGVVYVADAGNHTIRTITAGGVVATLAGLAGTYGNTDGTGTAALFWSPEGIAVDSERTVYVAESDGQKIRKIESGGVVTTLAGRSSDGSEDGSGTAARFRNPSGVAVGSAGTVYVADSGNGTIRAITSEGVVTTLAGSAAPYGSTDGVAGAARFNSPLGVGVGIGGTVYVADVNNDTIRKITNSGVVTTLAGAGWSGSNDGIGVAAEFFSPAGVAVDTSGTVYVADTYNSTIRKITSGGVVSTLAGLAGSQGHLDGSGSSARFDLPQGVAVDTAGTVYVADTGSSTIRKITGTGIVTTLAGDPWLGCTDGTLAASFCNPSGITVDRTGAAYVADTENHTIRKIANNGVVTTLAGRAGWFGNTDGAGDAARFRSPKGVAVDDTGTVYVADSGNHTIRKITTGGVVTTLAGVALSRGSSDGPGSVARFNYPFGVAVDSIGTVYVADANNNAIRIGTPAIPDVATIDAPSGPVGVARQLNTSPQTATNWRWTLIRRPSGSVAQLSSAPVRNPTFTPDVADLFVFRLVASNTSGSSITTVSLSATPPTPPSITNINPNRGPTAGGQSVVITGTSLFGANVTIGGIAAAVTGTSATSATFTTPAHAAGAVNVTVTTAGGSATSTAGYTYVAAPTITSITPNNGPAAGGQSVRINGANLSGATVTIGGNAATVTATTASTATFTTPAHAVGVVSVSVATAGGTATAASAYTYCSISISPTFVEVSAAAQEKLSFVVATGATCARTAESRAPLWITITSGASGMGTGTVEYSVKANDTAMRTGYIDVGGLKFRVTQAQPATPVNDRVGQAITAIFSAATTTPDVSNDASGDCAVTPIDVFYLVNTIFASGPPIESCPTPK